MSMFRLSEKIAKLEDRCGKRFERLRERHRGKWSFYFLLGAVGLYFYGMFINSVRLGIRSTFNATGEEIASIWVVNPFRNFFAVFTPTGFGVTAVGVLMCWHRRLLRRHMVFVTDGQCALPEDFLASLKEKQARLGFQITGVLLDQSSGGFSFSLEPFCSEILRTSEITREQIAGRILSARV